MKFKLRRVPQSSDNPLRRSDSLEEWIDRPKDISQVNSGCEVSRAIEGADRDDLLAWAGMIANQEIELDRPVRFVETTLRSVRVVKISDYARTRLQTVAAAEMARRGFTWEPWTVDWHEEREEEAVQSLGAMQEAMEEAL